MAELADAADLGSVVLRRAGSSPVNRIFLYDDFPPNITTESLKQFTVFLCKGFYDERTIS